MPPSRLIKPALRTFQPYTPGLQPPEEEGWVKLNTNEAPWPPSPRVLEAIRSAVDESLRLYPDPLARAAREAVARRYGLEPSQVALGNGGDELIELCFRAFVGVGDRVAFPHPTYPLLGPLCRLHEVSAVPYPWGPDHSLPDSLAADPAPLKFLVNPNSPTGTWLGREPVQRLVQESRGVVVVDEAYVDFAPEDRLDLVREGRENVLLVRTFSKSYALAGMRVGYALGHRDLIAALDLVKDSYNLDRLAIVAAVAAIGDRQHQQELVRFVVEERAWLAEQLRGRGFEVLPSAANFLFVRPPEGYSGEALAAGLRRHKVLVRDYQQDPIAGWLRVTVGSREQHQVLLRAMEEVMSA